MKIENVMFNAFEKNGLKGFVKFDVVGEFNGKPVTLSMKDWTVREFTKDGNTRLAVMSPSKAPKEGGDGKWMDYVFKTGDGWWAIQDTILAACGFGSGPPKTATQTEAAAPAKTNPFKNKRGF
jgi:hypothetical protein